MFFLIISLSFLKSNNYKVQLLLFFVLCSKKNLPCSFYQIRRIVSKIISKLARQNIIANTSLDNLIFLYYYANSQKTLKTKKPRTLDSTGFTACHPGLLPLGSIGEILAGSSPVTRTILSIHKGFDL